MSVILSRTDYVELKCFGRPKEYPVSTMEAVGELRTRGLDAREHKLLYLVRTGVVTPERESRNLLWSGEAIDQAAFALEKEGAYTPSGHMCVVLGLNYADYLRSLRNAVDTVNAEFGMGAVSVNSDLFVMHAHPPRWTSSGRVEFTLCDDVRQELEAARSEAA